MSSRWLVFPFISIEFSIFLHTAHAAKITPGPPLSLPMLGANHTRREEAFDNRNLTGSELWDHQNATGTKLVSFWDPQDALLNLTLGSLLQYQKKRLVPRCIHSWGSQFLFAPEKQKCLCKKSTSANAPTKISELGAWTACSCGKGRSGEVSAKILAKLCSL